MGVPIIENWSKIQGKILGVAASVELDGFSEVEMDVRRVDPVEDFPNLLEDTEGTKLVVHFPTELLESEAIETGTNVSCWVRKAGLARCFVHREHVVRIEYGGSTSQAGYS